jgi:hypothetical protein
VRPLTAILLVGALTLTGCDRSITLPAHGSVGSPAVGVTVPLSGRASAQLDVVAGFTTVLIRVGSIGGDLVQVSGDSPAGPLALATAHGNVVTISRRASAPSGAASDTVVVLLNSRARWGVELDGGASTAVIDLSGARTSGIAVNQGVSSLQVTLGPPSGETELAIAGGASSLHLYRPANEAVRATLSAGAGTVVIDGTTHAGIAAGTSFTTPGWPAAADRVDVECSAGLGTMVIDSAH